MCFKVLEDIGCGNSETMSKIVSYDMYKTLLGNYNIISNNF